MRPNPLVKIPSAEAIDKATAWVYEQIYYWLPGSGSDLTQVVPHRIVQGDMTFPIDVNTGYVDDDQLDRDEYYDYEVDPAWEGTVVGSNTLRMRQRGKSVEADLEAWIVNEPRASAWLGDCEVRRDGSATIRVMFNWAHFGFGDMSPRTMNIARGMDTNIYNQIRAILVHEIVHWLDPASHGEQDDSGHQDPAEMVLPWDIAAWEKAYATDPREFEPLKREAFERLKEIWRDAGHPDVGAFPMHLWRRVMDEAPNIATMMSAIEPKRRVRLLREVETAFLKHVWRVKRRRELGYD